MGNFEFTIHVPVYNVEKYLERCIESILSQTYKNFEIILTDDGSTDSSGIICDKYAEKYENIKVFHNENQGLLMTRCFSIGHAQGVFSLFVDSDDYIEPNTLERVHNIIKENSCDLIMFHYNRVSAKNTVKLKPVWNELKVFETKEEKNIFYEKFLIGTALNNMCMKVAKTELLKADDTDYEKYSFVSSAEDLLKSFYIVFNANKIAYTPEVFYNYWTNPLSITRTFSSKKYKSISAVREHGLTYFQQSDVYNKENIERYALVSALGLLASINEVALSTCDKESSFDEFNDNEYFRNFVLKNLNKKDLSFCEKRTYNLFLKRKYGKMVFYIKSHYYLIKILSKIKRGLFTIIGKGNY